VPLPELLAALEREAEARAAEELKRAEDEAEGLRQAAAGKGTLRVQERLAEHARALRALAEERLVEARRKGEARVLEARRELLDRVFEGALALQGDARGWTSYGAALERDIRTLLALTPGEDVTLLCSSADRTAVVAAAGAGATVEASSEVMAGVRLRSAGGRLEMDRSLAARLGVARASLAIRLVQQLEGGR
jgi:vacuolar-type H+-ATPase subunit E/Vma4